VKRETRRKNVNLKKIEETTREIYRGGQAEIRLRAGPSFRLVQKKGKKLRENDG